MEMFLNLSKGREELKALLAGNLTKKSPGENRDERLEQPQAEVEAMRTHMLGQMALIQGLSQGQEEMRAISEINSENMRYLYWRLSVMQ